MAASSRGTRDVFYLFDVMLIRTRLIYSSLFVRF
jgi:hypothetical protein